MEISNGNNFYMIEQNTILFWGMNNPIWEIIISKFSLYCNNHQQIF